MIKKTSPGGKKKRIGGKITSWTSWLLRFLTFTLLILLSITLIIFFVDESPFVLAAGELFIILIIVTVKVKASENFKAFTFNLSIIVLTLGLAEAYFGGWFSPDSGNSENIESISGAYASSIPRIDENTREEKEEEGVFSKYFKYKHKNPDNIQNRTSVILDYKTNKPCKYFKFDELKGYAGEKNIKVIWKEIINRKSVYEAIYTLNEDGLRITYHDQNKIKFESDYKNMLFFGCSFTFGAGVDDNNSMPFIFEKEAFGKFRAYNFGFHGYGPHQMLRILESGYIDQIVKNKRPMVAVYQAITCHIERAAFNYPYIRWDHNGPKYGLDITGKLEYKGNFTDSRTSRLFSDIKKSYLLKNTLVCLKGWERTEDDIKLFIEIVKKSRDIFENKYHGKFYVLYWDDDNDPDTKRVVAELRKNKINIFTTEEIFKYYKDSPEKYHIPEDKHPSELAHERIADYILKHLDIVQRPGFECVYKYPKPLMIKEVIKIAMKKSEKTNMSKNKNI